MANNKNPNTRRYNRWQGYFIEDCACNLCLYWKGVKHGCSLKVCCCTEEKRDARKHGRITRKRRTDFCAGWSAQKAALEA